MNVTNAGKYNRKITIAREIVTTDDSGFKKRELVTVLEPWAEVKTTKGFTLISLGTDFEKAYTRFTIRYPKTVIIDRDMIIVFRGNKYTIEYLNNIDNADVELEIQAKEVKH